MKKLLPITETQCAQDNEIASSGYAARGLWFTVRQGIVKYFCLVQLYNGYKDTG